jgi:hypothetical protein
MPMECGISTTTEEFTSACKQDISISGKEQTTLQVSDDRQGF